MIAMITNLKDLKQKSALFFIISLLCLIFVITCSSQSFAEDLTLSLSSTQGSPSQTVSIDLDLAYSGDPLASSFNLDINYDPDVLENPTANEEQIIIAADKEFITYHPSSGVSP